MKFVEKEIAKGIKEITIVYETPEEIAEHEEEQRWWKENGCHCKTDYPTYYVPDGEDEICSKHHYRCIHCHKITQIG